MDKVTIGVDIAKDKFDISAEGQARKFTNTAGDHRRFIKLVQQYKHVHVVMEATGNYHLHLAKRLGEAGVAFSVINPLQLKRFGQMKLKRIKTDASDAALLALYGQEQKPPLHNEQPVVQQQLKQINTHLEQFTKQHTALGNLAHANSYIPDSLRECEQAIKQAMKQLERAMMRLKAKQEALIEKAYGRTKQLVMSVSGVGPRTTNALIAYVGDLHSFQTNKQLAAYMGLNPVPFESGTMRARSHISKQGNPRLRTLFYLCALSAKRHNKDCKRLYRRLIAAGKKKKVALIAVANKLIRQVFAVVKSGVMFDNDYVEKIMAKT